MDKKSDLRTAYEIDLIKIIKLLSEKRIFIVVFTIVVVLLFITGVVFVGEETEAYSETIVYLPNSIVQSIDINKLPELFTQDRILFQVYDENSNTINISFDDFKKDFNVEILNDDAYSLKVYSNSTINSDLSLATWKEVTFDDIITPIRKSLADYLVNEKNIKLHDYEKATQEYSTYLIQSGIKEKQQELQLLTTQVNEYSQEYANLLLLRNDIKFLQENLVNKKQEGSIQRVDSLIFVKIISQYLGQNSLINYRESFVIEDILSSELSKEDISLLLVNLDNQVNSSSVYLLTQINQINSQIVDIRILVENDLELNKLKSQVNLMRRQYSEKVEQLEDVETDGFEISTTWENPEISKWSSSFVARLSIVALAAFMLAVVLVTLRDWWLELS